MPPFNFLDFTIRVSESMPQFIPFIFSYYVSKKKNKHLILNYLLAPDHFIIKRRNMRSRYFYLKYILENMRYGKVLETFYAGKKTKNPLI